jgi:hypothetical protein
VKSCAKLRSNESQAETYVPRPYGPNARTGLKRETVALCTWVIDISPDKVDIGPGYIHPRLVAKIAEKIEKLKSVAQVIRDDPGS